MSITYTQKAIDANLVKGVNEKSFGYEMDQYKNTKACFGFLQIFQLCAEVDHQRGTTIISIEAFGVQVGRWVLDRSQTSVKIALRPGLWPAAWGELDLEIGINWTDGIFMSGKACACAALVGCTCAEFKDHYIIHF